MIQNGIFYRLDLTDKNHVGWLVVDKERTEALVGYYMILAQPNPIYERLKLVGLNPDKAYHILGKDKDKVRYGRDLTSIGIVLGKIISVEKMSIGHAKCRVILTENFIICNKLINNIWNFLRSSLQ